MYAFTVGFKSGDPTPVQLYGPGTPVAEQDEHLDRAARVDDGGGYATVEIVYSNGRPKRRVDFTTPEQKAAIDARAAAALAKKEAAAQAEKEARIATLKAELEELEPSAPAQPESTPDTGTDDGKAIPPTVKESLPVAPESVSAPAPVAEALDADAEAAANEDTAPAEDTAPPETPPAPAPTGSISGKSKKAA